MLPKKQRADQKEVALIFREGRYVRSPLLSFRFVRKPPSEGTRISFIAPKNVSKSAVRRNRMRRRGYAALERYKKSLPAGISGVFIFNAGTDTRFAAVGRGAGTAADHIGELEHEIENIFRKIN